MKILITTDWYEPIVNGVVTSVLNLKKGLEENGNEVRVLTLSQSRDSYVKDNVYYMGSFGVGKIYPSARATFDTCHRFVRELVEWKPDVVHSQCELITFPFARKISKKCHASLIHTYHTVYEDYTHYFTRYTDMGKKVVAFGSRVVLKHADTVIVPTDKVKNLLRQYQVQKPIKSIPTGIVLQPYFERISKEERKERRAALSIKEHEEVLVSVGRLAKEKHLEEILEFMSKMISQGIKRKLLIVGDGPNRETLEQLTKELQIEQYVIFTGMVKPHEVAKYYQLGDVFVSASDSETQGLTYIEALASGLPSVCKKDDCLKGVLIEGYNGFTYTDYEWFLHGVEYIFANEVRRKEMVKQAEETAKKFSAEAFVKKVEEVYKENLGGEEQYEYNQYAVKSGHDKGSWSTIRS